MFRYVFSFDHSAVFNLPSQHYGKRILVGHDLNYRDSVSTNKFTRNESLPAVIGGHNLYGI